MNIGNLGQLGGIGSQLGLGGLQGGSNPIAQLLESLSQGGIHGSGGCKGGCCGGGCCGGGCSHCAQNSHGRGAGLLGGH